MVTMAVERRVRRAGRLLESRNERDQRRRAHPKMTIVPEGKAPFTVPYAPREATVDGITPVFTTADRGGRMPLLLRAGDGLPSYTFDIIFGYSDPQRSIEPELAKLRVLARSGARLRVNLDAMTASNLWRMTGFTVQVIARQHGTNHPTRATCSITLQWASDAIVQVGPLTGGAAPQPKAAPTGGAAAGAGAGTRVHTVVAGDTLTHLARTYYGNGALYPRIADANGIRDPSRISVGQKITIP